MLRRALRRRISWFRGSAQHSGVKHTVHPPVPRIGVFLRRGSYRRSVLCCSHMLYVAYISTNGWADRVPSAISSPPASLSFPSHPTIALSIPLSLIGLSSLFLSSFSYLPTFLTPSSSPTHELNATKFLIFLGIFSPTINLFSALFMRVLPPRPAGVKLVNVDERTPLLVEGPEAAREEVEEMERGKEVSWTAWGLLKDWDGFWAFGVLLAFCIGPVGLPPFLRKLDADRRSG